MAKRFNAKKKHKSINKNKAKSQDTIANVDNTDVLRSLIESLESVVEQTEVSHDDLLACDSTIEETLPFFHGALDDFLSPNIFKGWVFSQEDAKLRIRITDKSTVFGEANVDTIRPDLMQFNGGLVGWTLESEYPLSTQEFVTLAETIKVLVIDDTDTIIGQICVWDQLLAKQ